MANASDEFRLVSSNISHEGRLPRQYMSEGQGAKRNISPPLEWYNLPPGTKSLALVVHDIDAPIVPFTIWVVVNIPPTVKGLPEGFSGKEEEMGGEYAGIKEGTNDLKKHGWESPKLPSHGQRIEFKLYALDGELHLGNKVWDGNGVGIAVPVPVSKPPSPSPKKSPSGIPILIPVTKDKMLEAIEGHVLGEAVLMAVF
ncbi:hypothetical protein CASFOL_037794 [Castilleja foliolosa]|uniref:Uncharacterized protein n=1 Tax=Castilleja foliolosa TaxID=1961234 RepID=A0ABD3BJ57_9LAMI